MAFGRGLFQGGLQLAVFGEACKAEGLFRGEVARIKGCRRNLRLCCSLLPSASPPIFFLFPLFLLLCFPLQLLLLLLPPLLFILQSLLYFFLFPFLFLSLTSRFFFFLPLLFLLRFSSPLGLRRLPPQIFSLGLARQQSRAKLVRRLHRSLARCCCGLCRTQAVQQLSTPRVPLACRRSRSREVPLQVGNPSQRRGALHPFRCHAAQRLLHCGRDNLQP
mmetsp:Transcript_77705/g.209463  ORF Transcript_77705/g.209463 Transcript_77705/m.209463 type:complete len:219 (+) Transcript_77705:520-1176(+)